jgi:hypothetical protein
MMRRMSAFVRRWYFALVLALFVFSPELRRIVDWLTSVHKFSPFSVLPLASLLLGAVFVLKEWKRLGTLFRVLCTIWLAAFSVALVIGAVSGSILAATLDMMEFCAPIAIGLFLAATHEDLAGLYRRVSGTMLFLCFLSSSYAIYQFISPPPWDVFWVVNSGLVSAGVPEPFGLRAFGTLNSYAAFAHFTALTLVLSLPRLRLANWRSVIAFVPCSIALLLTSDRTAWLSFSIGLLAYLIISPSRVTLMKSLSIATFVCAIVGGILVFTIRGSDDVVSQIQLRFATLTDIADDNSFADRTQQTNHAIRLGLSEPLGQGLGNVGSAAAAGSTGSTVTLDNGYLARLVELGVMGFIAYLVTVGGAFVASWLCLKRSRAAASLEIQTVIAVSIAIQLMMLFVDFSTDGHTGLLGIFFWLSIFVASSQFEVMRESATFAVRSVRRMPIATAR